MLVEVSPCSVMALAFATDTSDSRGDSGDGGRLEAVLSTARLRESTSVRTPLKMPMASIIGAMMGVMGHAGATSARAKACGRGRGHRDYSHLAVAA